MTGARGGSDTLGWRGWAGMSSLLRRWPRTHAAGRTSSFLGDNEA